MAQFRPQTVIQPDNTDQVSIRIPNTKLPRTRRPVRPDKSCRFNPLAVFALTLALGLSLALLIAFHRLLPRYNDAAAAVGTSEKKVAAANYSSESKEVKFGHEIYSKGESEGNILPLLYNEGGSRAELDYGENDDDDAESGDGIDVQDDDHGSGGAEFKAEGRVGMEVGGGRKVEGERRRMGVRKKTSAKRKPKRQRVSGSSCEMKFLDSTAHLVEPAENGKFSKFSLEYTYAEAIPSEASNWIPRFAGYQTPQEREESFYARDQKIKCGFVSGPESSPSTGFDLSEDDMKFMSSCHIAVSSCIFGNSDRLRTPFNKQISRQSRKNVCFVMFIDEITLQTLLSEGQEMDREGKIGLWKIVVVRNLPFTDMRRVGKIPKFLTHRLFPSARYSIWLDSKLRLQTDPYLILEYFLWRKGYEYAISNHYDRHCVWEEVAQNKKLNKYNHSVIDQQFEFYQSDGLTRFDPSDPNKPLPSYVPEGSFIIRAHTPMSNLFSCLWFNEVDHFTPRDQLSFAYTYLKLTRKNPGKTFHLNMFKDCERRMIAKLFHHRAEEKRTPALTVR